MASTLASLSDHSNPTWTAEQHGFNLGCYVVKKGLAPHPESLFVVFDVAEEVTLKQICSYNGSASQIKVALADLFKEWSCTKMEPPTKMAESQVRANALSIDHRNRSSFAH